ncbi:hypothetical protein ACGFIR_19925 [Micromonospora sp. NPDC049051]
MADLLTAEAVRDELGELAGWCRRTPPLSGFTGRDLGPTRRIGDIVGSVG